MMFYSVTWLMVDVVTNQDKYYFMYISNWVEIIQCIYFCKLFFCSKTSEKIKFKKSSKTFR